MAYESNNLHYIYYVEYYKNMNVFDVTNASFREKNKCLLNLPMPDIKRYDQAPFVTHSFTLKTTYPGFLSGAGIQHESGANAEYSVGLCLDYVTGALLLMGSTVKGALKALCRNETLLRSLLQNDKICAQRFVAQVFESKVLQSDGTVKRLSTKDRDLFFDAIPEPAEAPWLEEDFSALHGDDPIKEPLLIRFLKVRPNVCFRFCFRLQDYRDGEVFVSAEEKCSLFRSLILLAGLGAKTNVGYGRFVGAEEEILTATPQVPPEPFLHDDGVKRCKSCGSTELEEGRNYCFSCFLAYKKRTFGVDNTTKKENNGK